MLKEAEGMIRTSPDTAYFLLREMEASMDLQTKADSAYHGLLLMEAMVMNGVKLTDTTSLEKLTHYYKERQNSLMQIRLLRLRGLAHRDGGCYDEAVKCYNIAIDKAKRIGEKRLLADLYYELANLHYYGSLILATDSYQQLSDSLFILTEKKVEELQDTVLWTSVLIAHAKLAQVRKNWEEMEQKLLQALKLSVALKDKKSEAKVSMFLSILYGEKGEAYQSLSYTKRNLSLRKGTIPKHLYYLTLGNSYQRIGMKDSAMYYLEKGKELRKKEDFSKYSVLPQVSPNKESVGMVEIFIERLKQKEDANKQQIQKHDIFTISLFVVLFILLALAIYKIKKYHGGYKIEEGLRKTSEELCAVLEVQKQQLDEEVSSIRIQLQQKEIELNQQKEKLSAERDVLKYKEQKIESLQMQLDKLLSDTVHVFDKINRVISGECQKGCQAQKMEDIDWSQLLSVMNKRWDGAIVRIQEKYQLTDVEVRLLCLNLADIPTAHMSCLFEKGRDYAYAKTRDLLGKLGIERGKRTYKKSLEDFINNQG